MASSVSKVNISGTLYWRFCFTSKARAQQGYPRQKWFQFNAERYKKSDIESIRDEYDLKYRRGEFDPWTEPIGQQADPKGKMKISAGIDQYITYKRGNVAEKTLTVYTEFLRAFQRSLANPFIEDITAGDVHNWVNDSERYNTRRTKKGVMNGFLDYLYQKDYLDDRLPVMAVGTKAEKNQRSRDYLTYNEFQQYLEAIDAVFHKKRSMPNASDDLINKRRDYMKRISLVMFYQGLRINELLHMRPAWIRDNYRFLRIGDLPHWTVDKPFTPKSQKMTDEPIVIPEELVDIYRAEVMRSSGRFDRMFAWRGIVTIRNYAKEAFEQAFGKDRADNLVVHSLRHSCASYWLNERGVAVQEVQRLMRHSKIETTMAYHHSDNSAHYTAFNDRIMKKVE